MTVRQAIFDTTKTVLTVDFVGLSDEELAIYGLLMDKLYTLSIIPPNKAMGDDGKDKVKSVTLKVIEDIYGRLDAHKTQPNRSLGILAFSLIKLVQNYYRNNPDEWVKYVQLIDELVKTLPVLYSKGLLSNTNLHPMIWAYVKSHQMPLDYWKEVASKNHIGHLIKSVTESLAKSLKKNGIWEDISIHDALVRLETFRLLVDHWYHIVGKVRDWKALDNAFNHYMRREATNAEEEYLMRLISKDRYHMGSMYQHPMNVENDLIRLTIETDDLKKRFFNQMLFLDSARYIPENHPEYLDLMAYPFPAEKERMYFQAYKDHDFTQIDNAGLIQLAYVMRKLITFIWLRHTIQYLDKSQWASVITRLRNVAQEVVKRYYEAASFSEKVDFIYPIEELVSASRLISMSFEPVFVDFLNEYVKFRQDENFISDWHTQYAMVLAYQELEQHKTAKPFYRSELQTWEKTQKRDGSWPNVSKEEAQLRIDALNTESGSLITSPYYKTIEKAETFYQVHQNFNYYSVE